MHERTNGSEENHFGRDGFIKESRGWLKRRMEASMNGPTGPIRQRDPSLGNLRDISRPRKGIKSVKEIKGDSVDVTQEWYRSEFKVRLKSDRIEKGDDEILDQPLIEADATLDLKLPKRSKTSQPSAAKKAWASESSPAAECRYKVISASRQLDERTPLKKRFDRNEPDEVLEDDWRITRLISASRLVEAQERVPEDCKPNTSSRKPSQLRQSALKILPGTSTSSAYAYGRSSSCEPGSRSQCINKKEMREVQDTQDDPWPNSAMNSPRNEPAFIGG